jgi:hypothetical protein
MKQIQQGDVLMERVDSIPSKAKALPHRTLREGEATGHAHRAAAEDVTLFIGEGNTLYMNAPNGTTVVHEEHNPIEVPPGTYRVSGVQEYDHFLEEARDVVD